jgi:hypothetical protein
MRDVVRLNDQWRYADELNWPSWAMTFVPVQDRPSLLES